ncbi:hypothetical protein GW17_00058865 [Ensete ventricosum]|nr:hypothetical protein GW17_00058865 [Ensete ventricosum]
MDVLERRHLARPPVGELEKRAPKHVITPSDASAASSSGETGPTSGVKRARPDRDQRAKKTSGTADTGVTPFSFIHRRDHLFLRLPVDSVIVIDDEAGSDVRARFGELQKLVVHSMMTMTFWIEGLQGGASPPTDGSMPKVVCMPSITSRPPGVYVGPIGRVLQTEHT